MQIILIILQNNDIISLVIKMDKCFCNYIKSDSITFKYAKGKSAITGMEFHPYHEIVLFMGGNAEFISDRIRTKLSPDTLAIIPKESYHQFNIHGNENDYVRCVFNFYDNADWYELIKNTMKDVFITNPSREIRYLFSKANLLTKKDMLDTARQTLLNSILPLLLTEIPVSFKESTTPKSQSVSKSITYINNNIYKQFTVSEIAKELNISTSTLEHSFRKEMNIPIYRYILEKKLILVQNKIQNGELITKAALECGFKDYSGFYKQYKKMFGISPSEKRCFF